MEFARKVWKVLVAIKDGLALLLLLAFFGLLYAALSFRPAPGKVQDGALLLDLDGVIVEEPAEVDPWRLLVSSQAPTREFRARDIERAVTLAAKDERIKAVVLDLSRFLGAGYVHLHDIGQALDRVRAAGKPVLVFANAYADDGVLLAAHSSEVWVDPMGGAFVAGPGGDQLYYAGLLERLKVKAHVFRVGTYKSAVEPYILDGPSQAARQAYEAVYGGLFEAWKADVRKARPKANLDLVTRDPLVWVEASGGNLAEAARSAGLVDRIGSETEFGERIAKLVGADPIDTTRGSFQATMLDDWLAANPVKQAGAMIGVVTIAGTIVDGDAGPGTAGGDRIADLLDEAIDGDMKALVVRVDSPGGSTMASERIRRSIEAYRARKIPVVVSMANLAASGGYWVSTPGQRIFADPGTITGSIGVFAVVPTFEATLADWGVTSGGVATTPLSGQPDFTGGLSPEVEGLIQASVESTYGQFLRVVGQSRGRSPQQIDAVAQGRPWAGGDARRLGLVDQFGDLDAALTDAAGRAGLGNQPWQVVYLGEQDSRWSGLLRSMRDRESRKAASDPAALVTARQALRLEQALADLTALAGVRGIQAVCEGCPRLPGGSQADAAGPTWLRPLLRILGLTAG